MNNLEALLRERLSDSRAMVAALDINADRVFLNFGAYGEIGRISLIIRGNEVIPVTPGELQAAWQEEDAAKRSRTPLDPAVPIEAVFEDGRLYAVVGGPEIILPEAFIEDLAAAAVAAFQQGEGGDGEGEPPANDPPPANEPQQPGNEGGDPPPPQQSAPGAVPVNPDDYLKAELLALAQSEGVEGITEANTKAEIAAAINAKRGV